MEKYAISGVDTKEKVDKVLKIVETNGRQQIDQDEIDESFREGDVYLFPDDARRYYYWCINTDQEAFDLCTKISYEEFMLLHINKQQGDSMTEEIKEIIYTEKALEELKASIEADIMKKRKEIDEMLTVVEVIKSAIELKKHKNHKIQPIVGR